MIEAFIKLLEKEGIPKDGYEFHKWFMYGQFET